MLHFAPRASRRFIQPALGALIACACALPAQAAPVWLSLGDEAFGLLRAIQPGAHSVLQKELRVQTPSRRGEAALQDTRERVHLVVVDEAVLPALSDAIHHSLRHCGGYVVHASGAEGREALLQAERVLAAPKAAGVSYAIDNAALVTPMLAQVQDSHILATIQTLSDFTNRYYTTSHGVAASDALFNTWKTMASGRSDISVKQFRHGAWPMKSVILRIQGRSAAKQTVVLGAHLDSIVFGGVGETTRAPGADDDASGVASLTEALRVMIASGYQPERSIEFMAYAAEEVGLRGSNEIAARYQSQGRKVVGVMQLDMTNYKGSAQDIFIYTDYTSAKQNDFLAKLAQAYLPGLKVGYDSCGYACSDHASWSNRGFVASFPFEASFHAYDPYIHSANDTLANTGNQAAHAAKFSRLALAYAVELGSDAPAARAR